MSRLAEKECIPCRGDTPVLKGEELHQHYSQLQEGWQLVDEHHITKTYRFKNFRQALDFTNRVGEMSEEQGHHPELYLTWGRVDLKVFTHAIDGLSEADFVWADKADREYEQLQAGLETS